MDYSLKNQETKPLSDILSVMDDSEQDNAGEEIQRLSVVRQLPQLFHADENGCMSRIIPKVQQALIGASSEFHSETARAYCCILQQKLLHHHLFSTVLLPTIIFHIDSRDPVIANTWLEALLEVTELLPSETVRRDVLPLAIAKGQISQSVWHRVAACKLLGRMCGLFDQHTVKKDILPVVHSLCQDVVESVRACICSQLHFVAKGLPTDVAKQALIPALIELGRDEMVQVRVEATETIVNITPYLTQDTLKVSIMPLVRKICEQAVVALDDTLIMVARQFGSFCIQLDGVLNTAEKMWMVSFYHNLSHLGLPSHGVKKDPYLTGANMDRLNARYIECRQLCAYNFPAMTKFCASNNELLEKLYPSFCDFTTDPYFMVRRTVGAGLHEVAKILGPKNRVVRNQILTLLWDNMEEVLQGVVPQLGVTIEMLVTSGVLGHEQDGSSVELGRALLQCEKTLHERSHNWRLYADLLSQLEVAVKCLPSEFIYTHLVSLMLDKMHRVRPLPCRLAAVRTLLVYLRYNLNSGQCDEIRNRLQSEFCRSTSCYNRMLFLRLCVIVREVFSRAYFKEHFFNLLLTTAGDKVANNRLLLVRQFPSMKALIVMPGEGKLLQALETCIRTMVTSEADRDVQAELRLALTKLDKVDTLSEGSIMPKLEDLEDRKKYEEEVKLASSASRTGVSWPADRRSTSKEAKPQQQPKALAKPAPGTPTPPPSRLGAPNRKQSPPSLEQRSSSFTNKPNSMHGARAAILTSQSSSDSSCTCYTPLRSDYQQNLSVRALVDSSLEKTKLLDSIKQKMNAEQRLKPNKSSKFSMEMSWLNLETDLKNELFSLVNNSKVHGDRNYREKSRFLSDFRDFNDTSLSKFINDNRELKNTIYNVRGVSGSGYYTKFTPSQFEEKLHFFEGRAKLDDAHTNNDITDCSCFDLTDKSNYHKLKEMKKYSYFSLSFEDEFYRDAGIKANDIIRRKFSGIPVYDKPHISSPKMSNSVTNKRRTWFGNETMAGKKSLDLERPWESKTYIHRKSETLPMRESVSLEKIGIGPRSKSFILPSTLIYSDQHLASYQSSKLVFDKTACLKLSEQVEKVLKEANAQHGAIPKERPHEEKARFGFRPTVRDKSSKVDGKIKTKIPVGRMSPGSSRSSSPNATKENEKIQRNCTKKPSVVRKNLIVQTSAGRSVSDMKNNRRSLDVSKVAVPHNLDRSGEKRRLEKSASEKQAFDGSDVMASQPTSSRLPVRRSRSEK